MHSTASCLSRNNVPITLDNLQNTLSTVFLVTIFGTESSFTESRSHRDLWMISSKQGIVSENRFSVETLNVMVWATKAKFHSLALYIGDGENLRDGYLRTSAHTETVSINRSLELWSFLNFYERTPYPVVFVIITYVTLCTHILSVCVFTLFLVIVPACVSGAADSLSTDRSS